MTSAVQSLSMGPIGAPIIPWKCRKCGKVWIARGKGKPKRCPNPKCATMAWDRPYQKRGRKTKKTLGKREK